MAFPRKFQHLLEIELKDVQAPDYVWLTYALCATEAESCGWGGWMIDAAFKKTGERHPPDAGDKVLPAVMNQTCPECGRTMFRTAASIRMTPSKHQSEPGSRVECFPIDYEGER